MVKIKMIKRSKPIKEKTIIVTDEATQKLVKALICKINHAQRLVLSLQHEIRTQQASIADSLTMIAISNTRIADKLENEKKGLKMQFENSVVKADSEQETTAWWHKLITISTASVDQKYIIYKIPVTEKETRYLLLQNLMEVNKIYQTISATALMNKLAEMIK
jgi:hypothetical protein